MKYVTFFWNYVILYSEYDNKLWKSIWCQFNNYTIVKNVWSDHHLKAAEHAEKAALHYKRAAEYYDAGNPEKAIHHAL